MSLFNSIRIYSDRNLLIFFTFLLIYTTTETRFTVSGSTISKTTTQLKFSQPYDSNIAVSRISDDDVKNVFKPISNDVANSQRILKNYLITPATSQITLTNFQANNEHQKNFFDILDHENDSGNHQNVGKIKFPNMKIQTNENDLKNNSIKNNEKRGDEIPNNPNEMLAISKGVQRLQKFILSYIEDTLFQNAVELFMKNRIDQDDKTNINRMNRRQFPAIAATTKILAKESFEIFEKILLKKFDENEARGMETGRLFLFKGLKKLLWPLFIGVQIAKSILLALFLPSILGSLGKMVGKGLTQISGFNHPSETVGDLDFKDVTAYNLDDDYSYPRPEASTNHFQTQPFQGMGGIDINSINTNNDGGLSRFGFGDPKLNSATDMKTSITKNSNSFFGSNKNVFKDFLKVPASSLLLSNYDPFYSPLLSRIDSVFAQLGLANGNESCRSKLICLMYANPAKYAPYSNLVSAQLSRELNELRKPTSDNDEILRFFKYMRAAKDGQDGVDCEKTYEQCVEFQDSENPVMITTFNDINKLVQARKFTEPL